ncbi:octanoyltransferase, partial [Acinetobacter baumannii]
NLDCALTGFQTINPCGYAGLEMVRIQDLVTPYPLFEQLCQDFIEYIKGTGYFNDPEVKIE